MGMLLEKTETHINVRHLRVLPSISEREKVSKIIFLRDTLRLLQSYGENRSPVLTATACENIYLQK